MYKAHRQDRVLLRELIKESYELPGERLYLISLARAALVEEASAWELLFQVREERWHATEHYRRKTTDENRLIIKRWLANPQSRELLLQEYIAEQNYKAAQLELSQACNQLGLELEKVKHQAK